MRHWLCLSVFLVSGLGLGYGIYPATEVGNGLRYGIFLYCLPVLLIPHFFYWKKLPSDAITASNLFLLSQFVRVMALLLCGTFLFIWYPEELRSGLVLFLVYIGAFLFFQLARGVIVDFCG